MMLRKGDIVELWVERAAYGGKGVARLDGFVIFIKGGLPGDRVLAGITKKRRGYAEARMLKLISPSSDRIEPPCSYSGYCGGCQWQHLKYKKQLEYKKDHVQESVSRIGALSDMKVYETIPSDKVFGYRNKMEFSFSDRRWLLPEEYERDGMDVGFGLGLHAPGTFYKVIDIDRCLLQNETGNLILQEVKRYVRESGVPVYGLKSHDGFWRFLTLRHSLEADEWMVNLVTSELRLDIVRPLADRLNAEFNNIRTIVNNINSQKAGIAFGERELILSGDGCILDRIGSNHFQISANSFFQTNPLGAEKLYNKVADFSRLNGSEVVLDLYSGTGTIPIFLSGRVKEIIGMEIVESSIIDAQTNCMMNKVENCRFIQGDVKKLLPSLKIRPDVLIIDPPRSGMHKDVVSKVLEMKTDRVIYVSCNPSTMARDMGYMSQEYAIIEIQPVDMFPHTYHIEMVARLERKR